MKLARISKASMVACLIGLIGLVGASVISLKHLHQAESEVDSLLDLRGRIDDFSATSDSLLLHGADPSLWRAYRAEGRAIQRKLKELAPDHPQVRRAVRQIDAIIRVLEAAGVPDSSGSTDGANATSDLRGPLALPIRTRLIMGQIAGYGVTLDTAIDQLLREHQRAHARRNFVVSSSLAGAAVLFGIICVSTFLLIHKRLAGPIRSLEETIRSQGAGRIEARAPVTGNDELADLATAFNTLADRRQDAITALEHNERMLVESQRIARVGGWRLRLADMALEWTPETYHIVGVEPSAFTPTPEAFLAYVHPEDLPFLREMREAVLAGQRDHDIEFRIVREDGTVIHVRECAELEYTPSGDPDYLSGTIQDVTEQRRLSEHLNHYRRLIEASSDRFCIIDSNHHYTLCNENYASLMGYDRTQVEGKHVAAVLGEQFYEDEVRAPVERCMNGEPQSFETERNYPYLGRRQVLIRYYPIASPDGVIRHVGMVMTELTDLKRAKAQLHEQRQLLAIAGRVARVGGWSVELPSERLTWSDVAAEIQGITREYSRTLDEAIRFYAPTDPEWLRRRFTDCIENGSPLDEEIEIVTPQGDTRWLRLVGEPVHDDLGNVIRIQGALQDISADKAAEDERKRLAGRLRTTLESITDAFFTLDRNWCFTYINAEAERLLKRSRDELLWQNVWTQFPEAVDTPIYTQYQRAMAEGVSVTLEQYYAPLGIWLDIRAYPSEEGLAVFFVDVTERHQMIERLEAQERDLRASRDELAEVLETRQALINALPAHIALLDPEGVILDVNDQWRHYGRTNDNPDPSFGVGSNYLTICVQASGECADMAAHVVELLRAVLRGEQETATFEYPCHSPTQQRWFRLMANRLGADSSAARAADAVVMHVDITERKLAEQELNRLAYEDALTGTYSRNGFVRRISEQIAARGWQPDAMVVMIDIRQQRDVNDAHGYAAGDELLRQIGRRLAEQAGDGTIVGRIGGDEFGVFLPHRDDLDSAAQRDAVAQVFTHPFVLGQLTIETSATFGFTYLGEGRHDPEDLLREAELALFQSRASDKPEAWVAYSSALHDEARERIQITRELRQALSGNEFQLHFQPKVALRSGELIGSEALLRWMHPEHGLLSPASFIDTAERSQLIGPIGEWVLHEACRCLSEWQAAGLDIVRVAVNVSLVQFTIGDLTQHVREALERYDVAPAGLTLEITESVFERNSEMLLRELRALHDMGVRLSLDDFGTGYSSLMYLQKYPFDEIKIDRGFVQQMISDVYSRKIVDTVLAIASGLGAEVVAEGVESTAMRDSLLNMGCEYGQGYYYSVPLEEEDFRWLLEKRSVLPLVSRSGSG